MANLTQNLAILQKGKEDIIDEINSKLKESDQETLPVDCEWADINNLLDKVNVKKDRSAEIDTNEVYSDICSGELNKEIVTGVTTITEYSMYGQKYLPKVTANNCTSIGEYAFYDCQALTEADFPNAITLSAYCFYNNKSLETIHIEKATTLGNYAFAKCTQLNEISLPKIQTIGSYAFQECSNLEEIVLNTENTYTIDSYAFRDCPNLKTDVSKNASTISDYGIYNTGILEIDTDTLTSLGSYAISHNDKLERISLTKLTALYRQYSISYNNELISINLSALKSLGQSNNNVYDIISNNPKLESIYWPNLTTWYGGGVSKCDNIKTLSFPALDVGYKATQSNEYTTTSLIASNCKELETVDLGKLSCIRQTNWTGANYLINNCYKLKHLNLSSLTYCNPTAEYPNSYLNYFQYCYLLYRVGLEQLALPALKWINPYYHARVFYDCRFLNKVSLPVLTSLVNRYDTSYTTSLIIGCPQLTELELPSLTNYYGCKLVMGGYSMSNDNYSGGSYVEYNSKKYIVAYLNAIKEKYPDNYETRSDYIQYYERLHGGTINGNLENASPFNDGYQSGLDYNMQWCGLKTIKLPKLSSWNYHPSNGRGMFKGVHELEEIYLGDGTFTPSTTTLSSYFVNSAHALKKVVLNYPIVITANSSLTSIFSDCGHLNGTKYSFNYDNKTYYYENEEGLSDLYFYVPDNLVDSYKAATNWSTYASQIRPISELADLNIDSSITAISNEEYKNDQTLTSVAGYGIVSVGEEGFRGSSVSSIEFANCNEVSKYAFADCPNLERVQLKYTQMTSIEEGIFMNSLVSNCVLPIVTTIKANAFKNTQVSTVSAPLLEKIWNSAFENDSITDLNLPLVNTLGKASFKNNSINSLTLPEVITINDNAFEGNSLTEISIPKVTFIGNSAFKSNSITNINLPEVTTLGKYAFADNDVQEISIPKVIMIDDYAFANNVNLESINLGTVRILGTNIFDGCTSLTDITFEGYAVPTGTLPEGINLHVRESLVEAFEEAYPNNTIIGDVE